MTIPRTMSGWQLLRHGGPEALSWSDAIPVPDPGPDQALIRVAAAGVNNTDINTRLGWYAREVEGATGEATGSDGGWSGALRFPLIQGGDLCGHVVALGDGADGPPVGTRVTCPINQPEPTKDDPFAFVALGSEYDGAFAQYCVVPVRHLHDVSASPLSDAEIAAMPCAHGTALNLLTRAGVGRGDRVLVTGASGGVGLAAVALAHLKGAHVIGVTSPSKADAVRAAGASATLDRDADLPDGMDAVIDVVGGDGFAALIRALRPGGRIAVSGAIAGPMARIDLRDLYLSDRTIIGCTHQAPEVFADLVQIMNAGSLRPLIARTYALRDLPRAQEDFQSKSRPGKLVLIPE
jgi:NADPH:quinone reductase-like Zn-dependent oxidoreductase